MARVRDDRRCVVAECTCGAGDGNCEDEGDTLEIADSSSGSTSTWSILDSGGRKLPCST